jgi:hypothetical protein
MQTTSDRPDMARDLRPKAQREERKTEDQMAREKLGGVKGSPELPPAPLTRQEAEQMPRTDDPGHVA